MLQFKFHYGKIKLKEGDVLKIRHAYFRLDEDYPFRIGKTKVPPNDDMDGFMHWHDYFEISSITKGTGTYYIDDKKYPVSEGDIVIINNVEPHILITDDAVLEQYTMIFEPSLIWSSGSKIVDYDYIYQFNNHGADFDNLISHGTPLSEEINTILKDIYLEYRGQADGWKLMIKAKLLALLTLLFRHFKNDDEISNRRQNLIRLREVFDYIGGNFNKEISLEKASEIAHFTPQYLSYYFKNATSVNFTDYVSKMRVNYAINLLKTTDDQITLIAEKCGFNSLANFNAAFKKYVGKTPSVFRKTNK